MLHCSKQELLSHQTFKKKHKMAFFSLYISFFIVTYITYKKIIPIITAYVYSYRNKIKITLHNFDQERQDLMKELNELNHEAMILPEKIDQIFKEGQQKILNLKKIQSKTLVDMLHTKQGITQYHLRTLQERSNQEARDQIAQNVQNALILWTKNEKGNEDFHNIIKMQKLNHIKSALLQ
jgi:hypothetical protein